MAAAGSAASLSVFDYSQVELLDSPLRRQFDTNHAFFLHLDDDRMLKIYRQRVGMPAPGADMGGWYDDFCPGAHFGQYVSALARFARAVKPVGDWRWRHDECMPPDNGGPGGARRRVVCSRPPSGGGRAGGENCGRLWAAPGTGVVRRTEAFPPRRSASRLRRTCHGRLC